MSRDNEKFHIDFEESVQHEKTIRDSEDLKRRLLNLPQQSSSLNSGRKGGQSSSSSSNHFNRNDSRNKDEIDTNKRQDNQQKRKDRDNQQKNQNNNNRKQTSSENQKTNPNTLNKKVQEKGKEQLKEQAKRRARQATRQAVSKQVKRKGAKQAIKAGAKVAAKAIKTLAVKGIALATKALLALVSTVGLPAFLIGASVVVLILILMTLSSTSIGTGNGIEEMGEEAQELREYIVEASESTIDRNKPEQLMYKVPEELLAAIVQLDSWLKEQEGEEPEAMEKYKDLIDEFTEELKPEFTYETFTEWTETRVKECKREETETTVDENGNTVESTYCAEYGWSEPTRTEQKVDKITKVVAWNGTGTFEYEGEESEWEGDSESQTRTYRYVIKNQNFEYDFSKLDSVLNSHDYQLEDKKWFEFFYENATQVPMGYTQWLETGIVDFSTGGGYYFDGEIIPGEGVPPQFMPYYRSAEEKYGIPWYILAAIHFHETTFSTHPSMTSSVGAIGHMQFMPLTWIGWNYPGGTRLGNAAIPDHILTDPAQIAKYGGYGTDANGDGRADPWDVEDAIHTTAKYLQANGFAQNQRNAIWHYNHSQTYVNNILSTAEKFKNAATYKPNGLPEITPGMFMVPLKDALVTSHFGPRWGRNHNGIDLDHPYPSNTAPIVAAADGVVTHSQWMNGYGNIVIIKHNFDGTRYDTAYAHLDSRAVSVGQTVKKGQFIGMMGNTGGSKGAHLHFEIHSPHWASGQPHALNPALFINVPDA